MRHLIILLAVVAAVCAGCTDHSRRSEIEARRTALHHKQDSALAEAQQRLAVVDSMLEAARRAHDAQHEWVMAHATELNEHSPEVLLLNQLRAHRDSLEAEWQTLGAKIKYIRMRKNENNS